MRDLLVFASSMSQLPPALALLAEPPTPRVLSAPRRRGVCTSCGGGTYKGNSVCAKCTLAEAQATRAQRVSRPAPAQPRPRVSCSVCGQPMISHGADRPTCGPCRRKYGIGVCSKCGGPKRQAKPGLCRACRPVRPKAGPGVCKLCEESYVPGRSARPDQSFCSRSCKTFWQNGARPPFQRRVVVGDALKVARSRARLLRHAQTWDGITDEEIFERDGWRCQIQGCKRRPIRRDAAYPHPRSKSIDHIIPLSLGGDDTAVNKRAAHLGCNLARGNRMTVEQLPLFGSIREPPLATVTAGERAVSLQRRKPSCGCGAVPLKGRKFCQGCLDQRAADAEARRAQQAGPTCPVHYYVCRYCGDLKACRRTVQLREVCPARACQLARLGANNLRTRNGWTKDEADAHMAVVVNAGRFRAESQRGGPEAAARRMRRKALHRGAA